MDGCGDPRRVIRKNCEERSRKFPQFSQILNFSGQLMLRRKRIYNLLYPGFGHFFKLVRRWKSFWPKHFQLLTLFVHQINFFLHSFAVLLPPRGLYFAPSGLYFARSLSNILCVGGDAGKAVPWKHNLWHSRGNYPAVWNSGNIKRSHLFPLDAAWFRFKI